MDIKSLQVILNTLAPFPWVRVVVGVSPCEVELVRHVSSFDGTGKIVTVRVLLNEDPNQCRFQLEGDSGGSAELAANLIPVLSETRNMLNVFPLIIETANINNN